MDILAHLNPVQVEAVTHTEGPLLILAGAGSGKTRVLTHRVAYLLQVKGVNPENILAITFTNKAADEMKNRLGQLLPDTAGLWVCTFHAACVRILRQEIEALGWGRNFVIYDEVDQQNLIKECLKTLNLDEKRFAPRSIGTVISKAKNQLKNPTVLRQHAATVFEQKVAQVYEMYQRRLRENNALDFDDLIMTTVELLRQHPHIRGYYQTKFRYIMVDEYQDTNHAQYVLVKLLAEHHQNICVVGDPDQSIYGWRGADLTNILEFERDYPGARLIKLEQNYRSTRVILEAANQVVRHNRGRKEKRLWTMNDQGQLLVKYCGEDEHDEARFVAERILLTRQREKRNYRDFAVFYRTHAQSRVFEEELLKYQIPYKMIGGTKFYQRKEIKDVLAYLRVVLNPQDVVSLQRVINVPRRGIGDASWSRLTQYARENGLSLYAAMAGVEQIPELAVRVKSAFRGFYQLIEYLRKFSEGHSVTALVEELLERSEYRRELVEERTPEAETRLENLNEFLSVTKEFDRREPGGSLSDFLTGISLITDLDDYEEQEDAVVLMTLHGAKGLEFPVVFLTGMEEGIFPHSRALFEAEELEEERRLCYVGITRAREKLYLTHAWVRNLYGRQMSNLVSRFIQEIPPHLITEQDPLTTLQVVASPAPVEKEGREPSRQPVQSGPRRNSFPLHHAVTQAPANNQPGSVFPVYRVGDRVNHRKWGPGVVVQVKGEGEESQVAVAFPELGIKNLLLKYAPLEKI
ncbi:MAG: DNA helicase PcrA [Firmicutes bacterium]|nr:DNA helicase PcrA [Bacillota bacterium]